MATGVGTSFDLDALDKAIKSADKGIENLIKNGQRMEQALTQNFRNVAEQGVGALIGKLSEAKQALNSMGGKATVKLDVSRAVDEVVKLTQSIEKVGGKNNLAPFDTAMQQMMDKIVRLKNEIDTFKSFEGGNLLNTKDYEHIGKVSDELNSLMKQYAALEEAREKMAQSEGNFSNHIDNVKGVSIEYQRQKAELDKLNEAYRTGTSELQKKAKTEIDAANNAIKSLRELQREYEKNAQANRQSQRQKNTSYEGALDFSSRAKSINREKLAIQYLTEARNNLSKADADYQNKLNTLNARIKQHNKNIQEATAGARGLQEKHRGLMDTSGQLARAMAAVFSVSAIKGYVNKLMQIRGEFELQQRSLQVLLQNKDEANALWDKTVALAVKSPYTTKQLVTATKQLAAYRVESEKLYETNKMLADVSIGLGVDMNRLILAFGQVKAANFLRGTELRQFSEAGVNMLDELAKRFTALEGRAVSVGEVFERISKRMVSFADVEAVFKTITSEGGTFYQMQEKQSETLKGMLLNLKDSYELALNDMGKTNEDVLKAAVSTVKVLVDNWKTLSEILKAAVPLFGALRVGGMLKSDKIKEMAIDFGVLTNNIPRQLKPLQLLELGWKRATTAVKSFTKSLALNPWLLAITAVAYVVTKLVGAWRDHQKQLDEITEKYEEIENKISNVSVKFSYSKSEENLKTQYQKLADIAKNDLNLEIEVDLRGLSEAEIKTKFANLRNEIANTIAFAREFEQSVVNSDVWWKPFDNIEKAFKRFGESATNLSDKIRNNSKTVQDFLQQTGLETQLLKDLLEEPSSDETELDYIRRVSAAYRLYEKTYHKVAQSIAKQKGLDYPIKQMSAIGEAIGKYEHDLKNAEKEFDEFAKTVNIPSNYNKEQRTLLIKTAIDKKGYTSFVRDLWYRLSNEKFDTEIQIQKPKPQSLEAWAKRVSKEVNKLNAQIKAKSKDVKDIDLFPLPKVGQTKEQYLALAKDVIDIAEATYTKNQQIVEDEEVARTNLLKDYAKTYKDILNIETKNKTNKKEQEAIRLMNERISLIKEMHKEYQKLREEYDHATSQQKVLNAYAKTFTQLFGDLDVNLMGSLIDSEALSRFKETGEIAVDVANKLEELAASGTHIRNFDEAFVEGLKELESFRANAYNLGDGVWTIGYGETKGVKQGDTITKEEADAKLRQRLTQDFVKELNNVLDVNKDLILTQEQYNALLDLTYQGGASSVRQLINMARNVESSVSYVEKLKEKIGGVLGEETAARFGEDFVKKLRESENIYQRIALLLQTMNLTVNNGKISKELYKGMQSRSDKRAALFATGKSVSDILASVTKEFSSLDISTKQGVVAFLKSLEPIAKQEGEKVAQALQQSIDGFEAEIGIDIQIQENKRIERELESLFGSYEISMELDKLNIPKDAMKSLFGVEPIELPEVRVKGLEKVGLDSMANLTDEAILASQAYKDLNEKQQKDLAEHLKKVANMERKAQEDRLKKYVAFARGAISERAKVKLEEMNTIAEIEKTFEHKETDTEEQKTAKTKYKGLAMEQARKEANDALQKLDWETFKSSNTFNTIFDDLENAGEKSLQLVIDKLKDFKEQWKDMPFDQMRQVVDLLQKAEEALKESDNPFTEARRLKKAIKKDGRSKEQAQLDVYNAEQQKAINEQALANYELFEKVANKQIAATTLTTEQLKEYVEWQSKSADAQRMLVEGKKIENAELDKAIQKGNTQQNNIKKLSDVYKKQEDSINQINKLTQDLYGSFMDLAENGAALFGKELDDTTKIFADMGASMADTVMQTVALYINLKSVETGAYAAGTALNTAMGVIGWIVMGVQLLSQAFKAIVDAHDNGLQKQIDAEAKSVERLQKAYEDLEEQIKNTYDISELNSTTKAAQDNLLAQISATERMIDAEEDKKKSDQDAIDGYKDEIDNLKKQYKELEETRLQELGAFATDENKKSGAEAFLDAWMEAYKQTGDGLSGLNDKFDEFFEDSVKRQMLQKATSKYLDNLFNKYDSAISDWAEGDLTEKELKEKLSGLKNDLPALNENLKKWAEATGVAAEFAGKDADLSGLAAGIQGLTEDQADILAAYWSNVSLYTQDTNQKVNDLVTKLFSSDTDVNPMLSKIQELVMQTTAIKNHIEDFMRNGTSYVKVKLIE